MYTRCPECETAFRITVAQLKKRDGLVRCGRCDSVFRADLRLFAPPSTKPSLADEDSDSEMFIDVSPDDTAVDETQSDAVPQGIPTVSDLSFFRPRRRWLPAAVWTVATGVLLLALLGQFLYFFRYELAQSPVLQPLVQQMCTVAGCSLGATTANLIPELTQTSIAPHPRYANALRIRATLVNRTEQTQRLPLVQVALTDSNGRLVARRTFAPAEYADPAVADTLLGPNVVVQALIDVTNPDNKAAGYEVQLFSQQSTRAN